MWVKFGDAITTASHRPDSTSSAAVAKPGSPGSPTASRAPSSDAACGSATAVTIASSSARMLWMCSTPIIPDPITPYRNVDMRASVGR